MAWPGHSRQEADSETSINQPIPLRFRPPFQICDKDANRSSCRSVSVPGRWRGLSARGCDEVVGEGQRCGQGGVALSASDVRGGVREYVCVCVFVCVCARTAAAAWDTVGHSDSR